MEEAKPKTLLDEYSYETLLSGSLRSDSFYVGMSFPTLQSASGILQNPSGYTATGRRVWGGGIVKLTKKEWKPWPIDLLMQHLSRRRSMVKRALREAEMAARKKEEEVVVLKHTESARGDGLSCVRLPGTSKR